MDLLEPGRGVLVDDPAHGRGPGERHHPHHVVRGQPGPDVGPAGDQVDDAWRHARFGERLDEMNRRERRQRGGLQHRGVAAHERGNHLPRRDGHREVPGRDHRADAERLAHRHGELVAQLGRDRLAVLPPAFARHEVRHVDRFLDVAARLLQHLAHLARHVARERLPCDRQRSAPRETESPPGAERAPGATTRRPPPRRLPPASASSTVDSWNTPMRSSWSAGFRFSKVWPLVEGVQAPPMKLPQLRTVSRDFVVIAPTARGCAALRQPPEIVVGTNKISGVVIQSAAGRSGAASPVCRTAQGGCFCHI